MSIQKMLFRAILFFIALGLILLANWFLIPEAKAAEMSRADITREIVYQSVAFIDWRQTRDFNGRHSDEFTEVNPILGDHPNAGQINRYFITTGLLHLAISKALPPKYRAYWQYFTLGVETQIVGHNIQIGIHTTF